MVSLLKIQKSIYRMLARKRWRVINTWLNPKYKTMLDVGGVDFNIHQRLKERFKIVSCDVRGGKDVVKSDVQNLMFKNKSFDIVTCLEVLEHVPNPVKAISELKRVCKHRLIVTVPNDPWFTIARLGIKEKEHLWSITPEV